MRAKRTIGLLMLTLSLYGNASIQVFHTASEVKSALPAAQPGDTFVLADGNYELSWLKLSCQGTEEQPIVVQAQNLLGAKVIKSGCITLENAAYIEFYGLDFDMSATSSFFKLQGAHHIRITRNRFQMSVDKEGQTSKWILVGDIWEHDTCASGYNRIDHNLFLHKSDGGALIVIDGAHGSPGGISVHDRIDHNIFRGNSPRVANEKETVRIGVSDLSMDSSYTVVEYNLFEDCDGDPEVVSVKSCCNTVRNNTFRRCLGTLCLRHGFNNRAEDNIFLGEGKTAVYEEEVIGCGGIRVYGKDHTVTGNYMEGLTGYKWDPAIALTNGDASNSVSTSSKHFLPENVLVSGNTFVRCISTLEVGFTNNEKYSKKPKSCRFEDNLIVADTQAVTMHTAMTSSNITFSNNRIWLTGNGTVGMSYTASQFTLLSACPALPAIEDRIMTDQNAGPYGSEDEAQPTEGLRGTDTTANGKKYFHNGQIVIVRGGVRYSLLGTRL